jgi:hypothetical protein
MLLAVLAALLLAACSAPSSRGGTLLTFTRSGGFAGFDDTLVVARDGGLTLTDKFKAVKQASVEPAALAALDSLVHGAEFRALAPSYKAEGADLMVYTVSVPGVAKVSTMDAAQHPAVLDKVLAEINGLLGTFK